MRQYIIASILLCMIINTGVLGQSLFDGCSSAGAVGQDVIFNCDFYDPIGLPDVQVALRYRPQADEEFTDSRMEIIGEFPYYAFTYETEVDFGGNPGIVEYYFSGGTDSVMATQSPKNTDDQFPPPSYKYAEFPPDAVGDTADGSLGGWLDLTGSGVTYSDSRVYGYLDNVTDTWPTSQGVNTFMYALGFISLSSFDSTLYAMMYINVPFVYSPGLYKLSMADSSITRLGDIDYTIDNGILHMACDLETFENDPDWPGWPPPYGFLVTLGITMTLGFSDLGINDMTYPTFYEPNTYFLDFDNNQPPELLGYNFTTIPGVTLTANVDYYDPDGNLPVVRLLFFDWGFYDMGSLEHIYSDTSEFEKILPWPGDGWHYYHFEFSDGVDTVSTPQDSIYISLTDVDEPTSLPSQFNLEQNYPNPFNASTVIGFSIEQPARVNITVYNLTGGKVAEVLNNQLSAGRHSVVWNGISKEGETLPSGVYFYRLTVDDNTITRKMTYLK